MALWVLDSRQDRINHVRGILCSISLGCQTFSNLQAVRSGLILIEALQTWRTKWTKFLVNSLHILDRNLSAEWGRFSVSTKTSSETTFHRTSVRLMDSTTSSATCKMWALQPNKNKGVQPKKLVWKDYLFSRSRKSIASKDLMEI